MKRAKMILCVLMAGCFLLLAACGGNSSGPDDPSASTGKGRFVESDITPPIDGTFTSYVTADGALICYDQGLNTRYESVDGGINWTETPGPGNGTDRFSNAQTSTLLPDGDLLVYIQDEGLLRVSPDGHSEAFPVESIDKAVADGGFMMLSLLRALGEDRVILGFTSGGMVVQETAGGDAPAGREQNNAQVPSGEEPQGDMIAREAPQLAGQNAGGAISVDSMTAKTLLVEMSTGQVVAELPIENAAAAVTDGTTVYIMDIMQNVSAYLLNDGASASQPGYSFGSAGSKAGAVMMGMMPGAASSGVLALGEGSTMIAALDGSLLSAGADGSSEIILESTAYSIGTPRSSANAVYVLGDGSIIIQMLSRDQKNRLYRYVWDKNAAINPEKALSIWSLEDNNLVRAAIAALRKKHPDAYITYKVALEGDTALSATDAIKTLNTELLDGSGPDIILLDGCPIDSYRDKGMLLALDDILDTSDMYENVLAPFKSGTLYCLPTQFLIPALMGSGDALQKAGTLEELVALVVNGNDLPLREAAGTITALPEEERAALHFEDLEDLCGILWRSSAPAIIADNKLNTDALREYLTTAKAISDKYALTETQQGGISVAAAMSDGGEVTRISGSLIQYMMERTHYGAFSVGSLQLLQMMMERENSSLAPFPGLTPGAWDPSSIVGISADTKVPEFAAELLQAMLSVDVQQLNYGTGLPVTRAGITTQMDDINKRLEEENKTAFDLDIEGLIGGLQTPSMEDTVLLEMMWSSVEKCCKGEIDIEGAVREIEQNAKNYLAERS